MVKYSNETAPGAPPPAGPPSAAKGSDAPVRTVRSVFEGKGKDKGKEKGKDKGKGGYADGKGKGPPYESGQRTTSSWAAANAGAGWGAGGSQNLSWI